jgi:hypothetical protein
MKPGDKKRAKRAISHSRKENARTFARRGQILRRRAARRLRMTEQI